MSYFVCKGKVVIGMGVYRSGAEFLAAEQAEVGFYKSPGDKVYEFGEKLVKKFVAFAKQFVNKVRFVG
jgi:hypothetical protein